VADESGGNIQGKDDVRFVSPQNFVANSRDWLLPVGDNRVKGTAKTYPYKTRVQVPSQKKSAPMVGPKSPKLIGPTCGDPPPFRKERKKVKAGNRRNIDHTPQLDCATHVKRCLRVSERLLKRTQRRGRQRERSTTHNNTRSTVQESGNLTEKHQKSKTPPYSRSPYSQPVGWKYR